jgi:hypothetical protein
LIELTALQWRNSVSGVCANRTEICSYMKQFFEIQLDWIYRQIESYPNDEYWHQVLRKRKRIYFKNTFFKVNLTLIQLNGLIDGHYNVLRGPRTVIDDPLGFL